MSSKENPQPPLDAKPTQRMSRTYPKRKTASTNGPTGPTEFAPPAPEKFVSVPAVKRAKKNRERRQLDQAKLYRLLNWRTFTFLTDVATEETTRERLRLYAKNRNVDVVKVRAENESHIDLKGDLFVQQWVAHRGDNPPGHDDEPIWPKGSMGN